MNKPANKVEMSAPAKEMAKEQAEVAKIGNFIVANTINVKGLRVNLARLNNYAVNGETSIQLAWTDGISTTLKFPNEDDMKAALKAMDARCL